MANYSSNFPGAISGLSIANLEKEVSRAQSRLNKTKNNRYRGHRGSRNKTLLNAEEERLLFKRIFDTIPTPVFDTLGVSAYTAAPNAIKIETIYEKQKELYDTYPGCAKKYWESNEMRYIGMLGTHATPQSRINNFIKLFFDTEKHCSYMKNRNSIRNQATKEKENKERYSRVQIGNLLGLNTPASNSSKKRNNLLKNLSTINFSAPRDPFEGLGGKRKKRMTRKSKKTRKSSRTRRH